MIRNHREKNAEYMERKMASMVMYPTGVCDHDIILREKQFFRNVSFFQHAYSHSSDSEESEEILQVMKDARKIDNVREKFDQLAVVHEDKEPVAKLAVSSLG